MEIGPREQGAKILQVNTSSLFVIWILRAKKLQSLSLKIIIIMEFIWYIGSNQDIQKVQCSKNKICHATVQKICLK